MTKRRRAIVALVTMAGLLLPSTPAYADNVRDAQWHLGYLNLAEAQRLSEGAGATVAVIDSGIDGSQPDLVGNVLPGTDFVDPGSDGLRDFEGHGTAMAGLIAAHGHGNGAGALGIAPKARVLSVRVGNVGSVLGTREADGITWAAQHGAKVICVAIGDPDGSRELQHAVEQALAADVVVVAGVGNRPLANAVGYPAAYPGVIAAAAVDQQGNHADVSVTGPQVVLAAPGVGVISTQPNGKYSKDVGTSDATAIISGVAALVRAKYPNLSAAEVVHRLTATATDKGAPGRDDQYGYGIVNPVAALTADVPPLQPSATPTPTSVAPVDTPPVVAAQPSSPNRTPLVIALVVAGLLVVAGTATAITIVTVRSRRNAHDREDFV